MGETCAAAAVVSVQGVTKRYPLFGRRLERAKAIFGRTAGLRFKTALENVSFDVRAGEALGIIGENGSGKSTLLRIISGISKADSGAITVEQPVAAILELGLGFHPEFTGRENALLYGSLMGLSAAGIKERLADIFAFAELGEFVDQPVRTYSSGMAARLAFAVATSVEPRVLVVDEVLAVGDGAFQKKCVDRMVQFRKRDRSVLFCSHAMYLVSTFCDRVLWLHEGKVQAVGEPTKVISEYEDYLLHRQLRGMVEMQAGQEFQRSVRRGGKIRAVEVRGRAGGSTTTLAPGEGLDVSFVVESDSTDRGFHVGVKLDNPEGLCLIGAATNWEGMEPFSGSRRYRVTMHVPRLPLASGSFVVSVFLLDDTGLALYDQATGRELVRVVGGRWTPAVLEVPHSWSVEGQ